MPLKLQKYADTEIWIENSIRPIEPNIFRNVAMQFQHLDSKKPKGSGWSPVNVKPIELNCGDQARIWAGEFVAIASP